MMLADADLATVAELIGGKRASLLLALLGGTAVTAGQLAQHAAISPSLASAHLSKLLDGGLITVTQHGRERRYRLAGPHVAAAIEAMLTIAPTTRATGLTQVNRGEALRHARTCYDHLAGELGVALTERLEDRGIIEPADRGFALTERGSLQLTQLGLDLTVIDRSRRAQTRPCLDWTERRPHLAGALGAAFAEHLFERGWLERRPDTRAIGVTEAGRRGLLTTFGLREPPSCDGGNRASYTVV
jgi:DNA-binding transcriptional ArsR family regulator